MLYEIHQNIIEIGQEGDKMGYQMIQKVRTVGGGGDPLKGIYIWMSSYRFKYNYYELNQKIDRRITKK